MLVRIGKSTSVLFMWAFVSFLKDEMSSKFASLDMLRVGTLAVSWSSIQRWETRITMVPRASGIASNNVRRN